MTEEDNVKKRLTLNINMNEELAGEDTSFKIKSRVIARGINVCAKKQKDGKKSRL